MSTLRPYRYYSILGVKRTASLAEIKRAYRMLAKSYHPDRNPSKEASDYFIKITQAYEVLSNPETRSQYDNSTAECLRCWTHEVIQFDDGIRCCRCHSEYKLWEIERLHKAFLSSQCSHCKYFYSNPFDCQASQIENPCGYFEELTDNDRRQLLTEDVWFGKAYDYMYNCSGNVSRCRYCGAISLNPKTTTCWNCRENGLECPACRGTLLYRLNQAKWKCTKCSKEYAYRAKTQEESQKRILETCPFCRRKTLAYDKDACLWRCGNCKRVLTKDEFNKQDRRKQEQERNRRAPEDNRKNKTGRLNKRKIAAIVVPIVVLCIVFGSMHTQGSGDIPPPPSYTYDEAVSTIYHIVGDVCSQFRVNESDKSACNYFLGRLSEFHIGGGIVNIDGSLEAEGDLDYCVAINTSDRGVVFFTVLPKSIDVEDIQQRLQYVYLKEGEKIGLLPAKFAMSNDYSWYERYLDDVYSHFDYGEYLLELSDLLDTCGSIIDNTNAMWMFTSQADVDRFNSLIIKYNNHVDDFNSQIYAYNSTLDGYPEALFYIEEYSIDPSQTFYLPPTLAIPDTVFYSGIDSLSYKLQEIDGLDQKQCIVDRVTDKNFVVKNYSVRW